MKVIGLCGGNGVILYPFKKDLVANIEPRTAFLTPGDAQWNINFKGIPLYREVEKAITGMKIKGIDYKDLDLILGAPDCGHSSMLSYSRIKKLSNPRDNASLTMFLQGIKFFSPRMFMLENLPKFLEVITKPELKEFFSDYKLVFHERSVWDWGNSQKNRVRLIVIGVKRSEPINWRVFRDVYEVDDHKTCQELTQDLIYGENGHIREDINTRITLYSKFKASAADIQKGWLDNNWTRWQVKGRNFSTAPGIYRNLADGYPNTARKANRQFNPEGLMMSPRELARIMGVPDSFKIWVDDKKKGYCINKGRTTVTKTCPMEIPKWLKKQIHKNHEQTCKD